MIFHWFTMILDLLYHLPNRKKQGENWTAKERQIFPYWNGKTTAYADPLQIQRKVHEQCPDYFELFKTISATRHYPQLGLSTELERQNTSQFFQAMLPLTQAIRTAFVIPDWDSNRLNSLTDGEILHLWQTFVSWLNHLVEDCRPLADSPESTASSPIG